jgi:hypothetical protein
MSSTHVKIKEVSLLFGGNERRIVGDEPIHQFLHGEVILSQKIRWSEAL